MPDPLTVIIWALFWPFILFGRAVAQQSTQPTFRPLSLPPPKEIINFIGGVESAEPRTTYTNVEETEIVRDPETHRITKVIIHRKAEQR